MLPADKLSWLANSFIGSGSSEGKSLETLFYTKPVETNTYTPILLFNIPFIIILLLVPARQEVSSTLVSKQNV